VRYTILTGVRKNLILGVGERARKIICLSFSSRRRLKFFDNCLTLEFKEPMNFFANLFARDLDLDLDLLDLDLDLDFERFGIFLVAKKNYKVFLYLA